jgi:hypothetical protein
MNDLERCGRKNNALQCYPGILEGLGKTTVRIVCILIKIQMGPPE